MSMVHFMSGEGRFRWLHARPGAAADLRGRGRRPVRRHHLGHGPGRADRRRVCSAVRCPAISLTRLGDVALLPHAPIAFVDPADTGENRLYSRHGSLTSDEMLVPLVALTGSGSI